MDTAIPHPAGRALSFLAIAFLTFDALLKILRTQVAVEGTLAAGYPASSVIPLGLVLLGCVVLYVVRPTAVLGAVLLTAYLGGAVATHVRLGSPLFSHLLFPVYVAAFVWTGLYLRDRRVRALVTPLSLGAPPMSSVTSKDGTRIAYERTGNGPPLILVDGALCSRNFGPMPKIAALLAKDYTVITWDRRGRGASADGATYSPTSELEDLEALIEAAGQKVYLVGLSSGAALALEAAARGLPIRKVVAYEPPYISDGTTTPDHVGALRRRLEAGDRGGAVKYFMRDMVNVPAFAVVFMTLMRGTWRKLQAVAHTLPYDATVMGTWQVPTERFAKIGVPVIAMWGSKTDARLKAAADRVAAAIPNARRHELPGQTHNVKPAVLSDALIRLLPH